MISVVTQLYNEALGLRQEVVLVLRRNKLEAITLIVDDGFKDSSRKTRGERPVHFLGGVGLVPFLASATALTYHVHWLLDHRPIGSRPLPSCGIMLLF
jgi:hypothetical protein